MANKVASSVGCWTLRVRRCRQNYGRVAESGLRHSTRNRAWGNPPWVRIPPLPPTLSKWASGRQKNVTIFSLPRVYAGLHIVCPAGQPRYYLLLTGIHSLLVPLSTVIRTLFETSTLPHRHDSIETRHQTRFT